VVLDRINRITRRTTSGFELALSVLFTSGIQHYAEIPEGMSKVPDYVKSFMKGVPSVWEDTKFIDGYPGKFVVMARRGDGHWFVAGINAEATEKKLALDLGELPSGTASLITDGAGEALSFRHENIKLERGKKLEMTIKAHGGFVLVVN